MNIRELQIAEKGQIPWYDIQQEGKFQTFAKTNAGFGHALAVQNVIINAYLYKNIATINTAALATDSSYKVNKGHGLIVGNFISYSSSTKSYAITAIDTSNGVYDLITLSYSLGVAIGIGDTLLQGSQSKQVLAYLGTTLGGVFVGDDYTYAPYYLNEGSSITLPVNKILQQGEALFVQAANGEKNGGINMAISGFKISADTNFSASKVMYCLGDSIANLSGYVTRYGGHMHWQARTALNALRNGVYPNGYDCRIVSDSMSGKTSIDLISSLKTGMKVIRKADLILFQHGVNDAYQGTTDAVWNANLAYMIAWRDTNYPGAKLVFVGATPLKTGDTNLTRLGQLRTIQATYHNPANKVYYVSLENAYPDVSPSSPYFTDIVHPTQLGQDAGGTVLGNYLVTIV